MGRGGSTPVSFRTDAKQGGDKMKVAADGRTQARPVSHRRGDHGSNRAGGASPSISLSPEGRLCCQEAQQPQK
ncbi:MAG: hypothetical protein ACLTTU_00600 [Bilophila wadsworthia]